MIIHIDFASVGMAVPDRVNLFRAQAMRSVGGNGWRMSHNPPIPVLLDILDRVGITVMDENRLFGNVSEYVFNMGELVKRDRNHPSVTIWSFCNEVGCEGSLEAGGPAFQAITTQLDGSRPTLANMFTYNDLLSKTIDVQGFSHQNRQAVDNCHRDMPTKPIFMSECCSCNTQRGEDEDGGGVSVEHNFNAPCVEGQTNASNGVDYVAGSMVWTLFDYYGEPSFGGWPHVSSTFGSFDLAGFPKAAVYWYRSWWLDNIADTAADKPFATGANATVHIVEHYRAPPPPQPPAPSMAQLFAVTCDASANQAIKFTNGQLAFGDGTCVAVPACANVSCPTLQLVPCSASDPAQQFVYANQSFQSKSNPQGCLDLWADAGPNVGLYYCHVAPNQQWTVSNGAVVSATGVCMSNTQAHGVGEYRTIHVYSSAPVVELRANNVPLGRQSPIAPSFGSPSYATWAHVHWPAGTTLQAVALDQHNTTLAIDARPPVGRVVAVALSLDCPTELSGTGSRVLLDGQDVALVRAAFVDAAGLVDNDANNSVTFSVVSGPGRIVGEEPSEKKKKKIREEEKKGEKKRKEKKRK